MSRVPTLLAVALLALAAGLPAVPVEAHQGTSTARCTARDLPDPSYRDSDCDGIDGQVAVARFVSPVGSDAAPCSRTRPCRTIQRAVDRASALGRRDVYVAGGTYAGFTVADGVNVFCGFGRNFQRDPDRATGSRKVVVKGGSAPVPGQRVTVVADAVTHRVILADLTLRGDDTSVPGGTTTVVAAHDSTLTLQRLVVVGGTAGTGAVGTAGTDAPVLTAPSAPATGGDGLEFSTSCDATTHGAGGPAGTNPDASSGRDTTGGAGGDGGTMDTDCGVFSLDYDARAGANGTAASYDPVGSAGDFGLGGSGTDACGPTTDGQDGMVANGAAGVATASTTGAVVDGWWQPTPGTAGATGENGSGGGGGGGGGGCDNGTDATGAGGGGGGAGGLAALSGGGAGQGGGASIGILAVSSDVRVSASTIVRGTGGNGGAGGAGGQGQPGGAGGVGGLNPGSAVPGHGGDGAHGGHGGGGAGGAGGPAVGVLALGSSVLVADSVQFQSGVGGTGGPGGVSAPATTGTPDDDGLDGESGPSADTPAVLTCQAADAC